MNIRYHITAIELEQQITNEAVKIHRSGDGSRFKIYRNPSKEEFKALAKDFRCIRGIIDPDTNDLYVWAAYYEVHVSVCTMIGVSFKTAVLLEGCDADGEDGVWLVRRVVLNGSPKEIVANHPVLTRLPIRLGFEWEDVMW